MAKRIGKTLPPAAAPLGFKDILSGFAAILEGKGSVARFEDELREHFHVRHCFTLSSGKAALVVILQALRSLYPEKDEVLIPAYTCYSVPSAIVRAGLKVRLCDLAPGALDFDYAVLEELMNNERLLAVIPTHLYGVPADVERVKRLAAQTGVPVVEDAAQSLGGEWNGVRLGTSGDAGLFSMGRGKALSTVEGGIIITGNEQIGRAIGKQLETVAGYGVRGCLKLVIHAAVLSVFVKPWLFWIPKALPFLKLGETIFNTSFPVLRLSSFQAGLARGWRNKIGALKKSRRDNITRIAGRGAAPPGSPWDQLPDMIRYPVLLADASARKRILLKSEQEGMGIADGYPDSIDGIAAIKNMFGGAQYPGAKDIAERLITLPVHPFTGERDIENIMELLAAEKVTS